MATFMNVFDFETAAARKMTKMGFDYYAGGANEEITLRENRAAFDRIKLRPRVLIDVSQRDQSTLVLGEKMPSPIIIAPTGFIQLAHEEGELAMARAAGSKQVTLTLSTMATYSLEDVAKAASAPLWFQLYVYKDRAITRNLVERAEAAGYRALVLTVDVPLLGRREKDERNRFHLPDGMYARNLIHSDLQEVDAVAGGSGLSAYIASLWDSSLTWRDVEWLRSITRLPVILKGILRADDAAQAVDYGASAIVVSNHGGRQLDTAVASIDALPEVAEAVGGRIDVMVDGGIRRGTDILKALALGAKAVMIGRPTLWGLAAAGEDGARQVLDILQRELDLAMALAGCRTVSEITPDLLA